MLSHEFQQLVNQFRTNPLDPAVGIDGLRRSFAGLSQTLVPPADATFNTTDVDGIKGEWISTPPSNSSTILLYLHGGGYVMGSPEIYRDMIARICQASGITALAMDYRLAPEHPFPAALTDAVASYRWLLERNIDPKRIVIAGDSAGGGLTLATLLMLRDTGIPLPAAAICLSPLTDLAQTGASIHTNADFDPVVNSELISACVDYYLGLDGDQQQPLVSPLYADLTGLPPLLLMVGSTEILLDDSTRLAAAATAAGVEVELVVKKDMIHVWPLFAGIIPEGQTAIEHIAQFMKHRLGI